MYNYNLHILVLYWRSYMKRMLAKFLIPFLLLSGISACAVSAQAAGYKIDNSKSYIGLYSDKTNGGLGADVNVLGWFDNLYSGPSKNKLSLCLDQHRYVAFITLQPKVSSKDNTKPNKSVMKEIAQGKHDTMIINYLKELSTGDRVNTELFVRFAHEMVPQSVSWYQ